MKTYISIFLLTGFFLPASAQSGTGRLHPLFPLLDEKGTHVRVSKAEISTAKTCGGCHDTDYIRKNSHHFNNKVKADCIQCHTENGRIDWKPNYFSSSGELLREFISIRSPENRNCGSCHGVVHQEQIPLELPSDFLSPGKYESTKRTGEIISYQKLHSSFLNLQNKSKTEFSWDIHAERKVDCVDCHYSSNNPKKTLPKKDNDLKHLVQDPRTPSIAEFLNRPDHRLTTSGCSSCHNPLVIHDMIPYKKKHMERVECQTCHVPVLKGPALSEIDATVVLENSTPSYKFRNINYTSEKLLNAEYISDFVPYMLPSSDSKIKPFNLVTEWSWVKTGAKERVSNDVLMKVQNPEEDSEKIKLLSIFDSGNNGKIEQSEWILDKTEKYEYFKNRLSSILKEEVEIRGEIHIYPVQHGVLRGKPVIRECSGCHSSNSEKFGEINAGAKLPGRKIPEFSKSAKVHLNALEISEKNEGFTVRADMSKAGFYIFGNSRQKWADILGLALFGLTAAGVLLHAGLRLLNSNSSDEEGNLKQVYLYSFYERLWHWTSAIGIILLLVTGVEIHFPGTVPFMNLTAAVYIHNILAFILIINAFLSLFYHLASAEIRQFFPPYRTFWDSTFAQIRYYTQGIFKGEEHPLEKTRKRKLNPLQQITYLAILNILLPLQVITGLIIWGQDKFPELLRFAGGITVAAPIHTLCSWLFLTFLMMHIYLTTTGHTWSSSIKGMVLGYEEIKEKNR